MKVIACLEDQAVIDKILIHLENQTGSSAVDCHLPERPSKDCLTEMDKVLTMMLIPEEEGSSRVVVGLGKGKR